jgi:sensor histidine kinase YesM
VNKMHSHIAVSVIILGGSLLLGGLISLIIGFTYERFIWVAFDVVMLDSLILGLSILFCLHFSRYLVGKTDNNTLILLLSAGIMLGIGILTFLGFFISAPTSFIYSGNRTVTFLLINMLFFLSINIISSGFVIFQRTVLENEKAMNEEKMLKTQMELKLLSSKINPHFLFNSLNLLVSLLKTPDKAETALINLSEILRYQLDFYDAQKITISDELKIVGKYLAIQKMRFGKKLAFHIDCETEGDILPMIIQPLVENCIKHNIDTTDSLTINITVENNNGIIITVIDSAAKLNPEMLNKGDGLTITKKRVEHYGGSFLIKNGGIEISFLP